MDKSVIEKYYALKKEVKSKNSTGKILETPENGIHSCSLLCDFCNGAEPQPDRKILRLSDLYTVRMKETQLELTAVLLNINRNHNRELMEACRDLKDYAEYVARVRKYARELPLSEAVERAITECIREEILKEFLEKNQAEVRKMSIYEYDQEKHIRMERQDAWEKTRIEYGNWLKSLPSKENYSEEDRRVL